MTTTPPDATSSSTAPASSTPPSPPPDPLEWERLKIDREKANLDYKKFIWGSVVAAIALVTIPPSFQLATAVLEKVRTDADRAAKQQVDRDGYIKDFSANAINQDIELRIRLAQYFAFLSTEAFKAGWISYRDELTKRRDKARELIDKLEDDWRDAVNRNPPNDKEIERLERNLKWAHNEVGYVEKDRNALRNPRPPSAAPKIETNVRPGDYQVFVQFAGILKRDDVRSMMETLRDFGWNVQGVSGGGERTSKAAGYLEIRYGAKDDLPAAQSLAAAVQVSDLTSRAIIPKQNSAIGKGKLEVWISK